MTHIEMLYPKQPFFLNATFHYCKHIVGNMGISHFYAFTADDMNVLAVGIPDGCIDIMYRCNPEHPDIFLSGTGFSPRPLQLSKGESYFGVRFIPGYLPKFRSVSFAEIVTRDLLFEELAMERETQEEIVHSRDFKKQMQAFLKLYCRKYIEENGQNFYDLKNYILKEILESHGMRKIKQIVEESGYSDRYITRIFKENYGMTPKRFSEIIKFQNLLQTLQKYQKDKINFMSIAMDYDYYDESHMLKFFRRYLNETPKEYYRYIQSDLYHQKLDIL